jgi:hypothetical protein
MWWVKRKMERKENKPLISFLNLNIFCRERALILGYP